MRSQLLNTLAGVLGLAALAASTPSPQHYGDPDVCALSISTVFVTVSQTTHTITHQQAPTSTIYVTLSASSDVEVGKVPTGTETRLTTSYSTTTLTLQPETVYITIPGSSQIEGGAAAGYSSSPYYETTVTHYSHVTVTEVYTGPITSATTATGPLSFIQDNGTTSWFNGQAPDSTVSLVVVTSAVIVVPVITPPSTVTSTTTLKSTIFETHTVILTETLSTKNSSPTSFYPVSVGTGVSFTGMALGGWNATSIAAGIASSIAGNDPSVRVASTATGFATYLVDPSSTISQISFITSQSIDIYEPHTALSLAFLSAESGFIALPPQNAPTTTSSASTQVPSSTATSTTAISSAPTLASPTSTVLGVSTSVSASPLSSSSSQPPYTNSTSIAHASLTSSALGVSTSASTSLVSSYSPQPSYTNSISAAGISSSSSALGAVTSGSESSLPSLHSPLSSSESRKPHHTRPHLSSSSTLGVSSSTLISASSPYMSSSRSLVLSSSSALGFVASLPSSSFSTVYASSQDPNLNSSTSTISAPVLPTTMGIPSSSPISVSTATASATSVSEASPTFPSPPAYASPTACGEVGDFTLTFDDIPPLSVSNQSAIGVEPEPIFNPYHQFEFSDGFTVGPPPTEPYIPSSPPLLVEFIPNFNINGTNPMAGPNTAEDGYSGDIGNGDHGLTGCFSFNMYGASFGCDSLGPPCDFTFTGYQLNKTSGLDQQVAIQDIAVPACKALTSLKCQLVPVTLNNTFQDLDKVRINVTVAGSPKIWWMDDLRLGWTNNTCAAGLCRISTPIH